MKNYRRKYIFSLIAILILILSGLTYAILHIMKLNTFSLQEKNLTREGVLIAYIIEDEGLTRTSIQEINELTREQGLYTAVIRDDGIFLYENGLISDTGHLELRKWLSESLPKKDQVEDVQIYESSHYLFLKKPLHDEDDEISYLLIGTPVANDAQVMKNLFAVGVLFLLIGSLALIWLGRHLIFQFTKPLDSITQVAIELTKGNYSARVYEEPNNELGVLQTTLNILARNLQEVTRDQEIQTDRLKTIIENMGMPLISIDRQGRITLINRTYVEVFGNNSDELLGQFYTNCIDHRPVRHIIEEVFMTEKGVRKEVRLPIGIQLKHFEVYAAPIISSAHEWNGIVLVFHDITELKDLEQIRKDFVANVSHELKTPVTSIKGFAETLLDGAMDEKDTLHTFLKIIHKEADRLQSLIHDLLELSRIERDGFQLNIEKVDLFLIVQDVYRTLKEKADKKNITLTIENGQSCFVEGDRLRIQQIILNLVTNAISYTPKDGKITIRLDEEEKHVKLSVIDTGIGIDKGEIPRIFERFYRVDKARSRNSGGTGLGLAIVKHLVDAHKGDIQVESEIGKGSCFTVVFHKKFPRYKQLKKY
mgnify:FL=1